MHNALALLVTVLCPCELPGDFVSLFTPLEYRYSGGQYADELFRYRLFIPEPAIDGTRQPLIVWLHGYGEAGSDNFLHLKWLDLLFEPPWNRDRFPFYLLAVQCPLNNSRWTRGAKTDEGDDMTHVVSAILDRTRYDYLIDDLRVYLAGVSSGGSGCWTLAAERPSSFAAMVPISSRGTDEEQVAIFHNIPIWAFHSQGDTGTPIGLVRATVKRLKTAGATIELTELPSSDHDAWTPAFREYHAIDWMLSQRRGQNGPAPGTIPAGARLRDLTSGWRWWELLWQIAIPALIMGLLIKAAKTRRKRNVQ